MTTAPIPPVEPTSAPDPLTSALQTPGAGGVQGASFSQMLMNGVEQVDQKVIDADALAAAFALDDSIPVHRVTYALEQARLSFELMLQVRNRLVEAYQDIARMQL